MLRGLSSIIYLKEQISGYLSNFNGLDYINSTIISAKIYETKFRPYSLTMVVSATVMEETLNILYTKYDKSDVNTLFIRGLIENNIPETITRIFER